jgi:hypothetical protein
VCPAELAGRLRDWQNTENQIARHGERGKIERKARYKSIFPQPARRWVTSLRPRFIKIPGR